MPLEAARRRRLLAALAVVAVIALVAGVLVARGASSDPSIAAGAAALVPADALVYVHLSTDADRDAVGDARALADRFPGYERLRETILARLVVGEGQGDVGSWLGDELALAFMAGQGGAASSLVLLAVDDEQRAEAFVARGAKQSGPGQEYRGVRLSRYGAVYAAFVGDYLALGQAASLKQAIDLEQGRGRALAAEPTFGKLVDRLPADRVADAYATADGLRRLLVPAGGAFGVAGVLLDRPDLKASALSLSAGEPGARMAIESDVPGREGEQFTPELLDAVPAGAMAYYGTKGLDDSAGRLVAAAGTTSLGDLLTAARTALGARGTAVVGRDLLALLQQETAVVLLPGVPAPTLLILARAPDEARTRAALERLGATLPDLLPGATVTREGAVTRVRADATEIDATVTGGKLVLSTSMAGIEAARDPHGGLGDADAFRAVVGESPGPVTSIVFLDFARLLRLAEQTGLDDSRAYLAVKPDLARIRAVGVRSTGAGADTSSQILLAIR